MLNIVKADLYRIFKSKGVYITLILLFAFISLQVLVGSIGSIGVQTSQTPTIEAARLTGVTAAFATMNIVDNYLYFMLPIIIFISAGDFSSGTIKNVLARGTSRTKLYFSKLILSLVFTFVLLVLNVIWSIGTATVINGFGGEFNLDFVSRILEVFLPQLFLVFAVICVGNFFVFVTRKTATTNSLYISFCILPMLLVLIISQLWPNAERILNFELVTNMRLIGGVSGATDQQVLRAYIIAFIYIIFSTVGGLVIFKRSEIK